MSPPRFAPFAAVPFAAVPFAGLLAGFAAVGSAGEPEPVAVTLGAAEPLPAGLYAFNTNLLTATAFQGVTPGGPQFEDGVAALRPRGLRFPGGTIANNYRWESDSFSEPTNDVTGWAGEQLRLFRRIGRPYDLPGLARVCRARDLEAIWVLNVWEETPQSVAALFDRLDELGVTVRAVEFGNEPYWDGRTLNNVWGYAELCRPLAAALRRARPDVRIGACFGPTGGDGYDYAAHWNAPLAQQRWYDAAVHHDYHGGQGFAPEAGETLPAAALLRPEALVDRGVDALRTLRPDLPVWFTEWNVGTVGLERWKDRGAELLFLAAVHARLIERRDAVARACFHQIYGDRFGTFEVDAETGRVETHASFQFFRLLGAAWAGADRLRPVSFAAFGGPAGDLRGFATVGPDGPRLFVLNRGDSPRTLALPTGMAAGAVRSTLVCPPEAALPTETPLAERSELTGDAVTLPAYSVSLIAQPDAFEASDGVAEPVNLFPRRPHLTLWHPPYAAVQPRFDPAGEYRIDVKALRGQPLAVVKVDLSGLNLRAGGAYLLDFAAAAEPSGGLVVKLPGAAEGAQPAFVPLSPVGTRQRFAFTAPADGGEVALVLTGDVLETADAVTLRDFRIAPAE